MITSVAYIAMHTSPLLQPGSGDAGGMNVYLDRLSRTMADRGVDVTVFTRRASADVATVTEIMPGYRVVHITAGPVENLPTDALLPFTSTFADEVLAWVEDRNLTFDLVHSHYWLSGRTGLRLKRSLGIPLANSFHTLGKVKDAAVGNGEPPSSAERLSAEQEVISNSDCVIASTPFEFDDLIEHYTASPERLCVSPPGVDHDVFRPGSQRVARDRLGFADERIILFAGRIQPLKGTTIAVEALAALSGHSDGDSRRVKLHIVGGASGGAGAEEVDQCKRTILTMGLEDDVEWFSPVSHPVLADHYRAADVVIVPSRSESFGLVAAEAQACGTPVVASNTGGLPYVVNASESGLLVNGHDPAAYASAIRAIIDHEPFSRRLSEGAVLYSQRFSWDSAATRMLELYAGITA